MTTYPHLQKPIIEKLDLSIEERINYIRRSRWIGYPIARKIMNKLDDLMTHPVVHRMPGLLVIGRSNNGKTQLVRRFWTL